jgi:hypothetical protein
MPTEEKASQQMGPTLPDTLVNSSAPQSLFASMLSPPINFAPQENQKFSATIAFLKNFEPVFKPAQFSMLSPGS